MPRDILVTISTSLSNREISHLQANKALVIHFKYIQANETYWKNRVSNYLTFELTPNDQLLRDMTWKALYQSLRPDMPKPAGEFGVQVLYAPLLKFFSVSLLFKWLNVSYLSLDNVTLHPTKLPSAGWDKFSDLMGEFDRLDVYDMLLVDTFPKLTAAQFSDIQARICLSALRQSGSWTLLLTLLLQVIPKWPNYIDLEALLESAIVSEDLARFILILRVIACKLPDKSKIIKQVIERGSPAQLVYLARKYPKTVKTEVEDVPYLLEHAGSRIIPFVVANLSTAELLKMAKYIKQREGWPVYPMMVAVVATLSMDRIVNDYLPVLYKSTNIRNSSDLRVLTEDLKLDPSVHLRPEYLRQMTSVALYYLATCKTGSAELKDLIEKLNSYKVSMSANCHGTYTLCESQLLISVLTKYAR